MADTAALVVALSAQLTKFEKDMQKAGIMAEKAVGDIEGKFAKMNPQVSASFLGNLFSNIVTKGIQSAVNALEDFTNGFVALKGAADLAEISLGKVYGISAALGGSAEANAKSIEKLTVMLSDMRRGEKTSFGDLKAANPAFFQNMGDKTFDIAENMARVAEMVKQAGSEVEKWQIAEQAGQTRGMVKELEKGSEHFRKMTADNQATGQALAVAAAQANVLENALQEAAMNAFGLKNVMADFFKDTQMVLGGLLSGLKGIRNFSANSWGTGGGGKKSALDPVINDLQTLETKLETAGKQAATFEERFSGIAGAGTKTADPKGPIAHPAARSGGGGGGTEESAFERANKQLAKRIELNEAEARTIGQSVAAQEAARTEALLGLALDNDKIKVTDELTRKIKERAEAAGIAAQKEADASKQFQELSAMSSQFGSLLSNSFADAVVEGKKLDEVFKDLTKSLLKMAINTTIMNLFNPGAGGQASPFLSLFGVGKNAGGTNNWRGGMSLVGEHGPELVNLPRGSQVVPADATRNMMNGGGGSITYAPAIDARGASVEAVARLARIIETDRAMFASRTVATIQQARRARVAGL